MQFFSQWSPCGLKITMLRIKIKYLKIRMAIAINIPAIAGFLELFVLFERIIK